MLTFDPRKLVSTEVSETSRPLLGLFLEALARKRPEMADLVEDLAAAQSASGGNMDMATAMLCEKYKGHSGKILFLTDVLTKANILVDELATVLAYDNFTDLIARGFREEAYVFAKAHGISPVYDGRYIHNFIERAIHEPVQRRATRELQGGQEKQWRIATGRHFREGLNGTQEIESHTPHPTDFKSQDAKEILRAFWPVLEEIVVPLRERLKRNIEANNFEEAFAGLEDTLPDTHKIAALMDRLVEVALTPMKNGTGRIRRLTTLEEIHTIAENIRAIDKRMPLAWHTFDRALTRNYSDHATAEDRLQLHIHYMAVTWGAGDKDGHTGKRGELTLYEKALLRAMGVQRMKAALASTPRLGEVFPREDLQELERRLEGAEQSLLGILDALQARARLTPDGDIPLRQSEFDSISAQISSALLPADSAFDPLVYDKTARRIHDKLATLYRSETDPERAAALIDAIKSLENFGGFTAKLEQRERSNELQRAIGHLLPGYAAAAQAEKARFPEEESARRLAEIAASKRLAELMDAELQQGALPGIAGHFLGGIEDTGDYRDYKRGSQVIPQAIAYHTLKRAQELMNAPDMAGGLIIAECKGEGSIMEALAVLSAVAPLDGATPHAKLIPLYEDFHTLNNAAATMVAMFRHRSYRQHLLKLAGGDPAKLTIEIMFAHSDNTKRAGTFASRAAIAKAHFDCREALAANLDQIKAYFAEDGIDVSHLEIDLQFFEGKSEGHFNRFGIRPETAMTDTYGTHPLRHKTAQGADGNKNHVNALFKRNKTVNPVHAAKTLDRAKALDEPPPSLSPLNCAVMEACMATEPDYRKRHYSAGSSRGILYAHPGINYKAYNQTSVGSRPSERSGEGASAENGGNGTAEVKLEEIRAIPDADMQYASYVQATFLGAVHIGEHLKEKIFDNPEVRREFEIKAWELFGTRVPLFESNGHLTTLGTRALRILDDTFREVTDLVVYGCVNTRYDLLDDLLRRGEAMGIPADRQRAYIESTFEDYFAAVPLVMKSFGMTPPDFSAYANPYERAAKMREALLEGPLKHLKEEIEGNWQRAEPLLRIRQDILMNAHVEKRDPTDEEWHTTRLCTAGIQPLTHGTHLMARDPSFAQSMQNWVNAGRPMPRPVNGGAVAPVV